MATLAKIFIAIIFVFSNVFLGFTIAAIQNRDNNPKYKFMRERWMREVVQFDCRRVIDDIAEEEGRNGKQDRYATVKQSMGDTERRLELEARETDALTRMHMSKLRSGNDPDQSYNLLGELEKIRTQVSTFAATIKAYEKALASVQRKYAGLQDSYQDTVRQFESLAIEKKRLQIEKERILEDHRGIEDAYFLAQKENSMLDEKISMMVRTNPELPGMARHNGQLVQGTIKSASEPPTGVVVISVGRDDGVTRGQRFSVFDASSGSFKARVHITEVKPSVSVGVVEHPYENVRINVNDRVRRSAIFLHDAGSAANNR
ncbi:MAG: hypothetical protein AB7K09_23080 [Planctomycetota bacterium]